MGSSSSVEVQSVVEHTYPPLVVEVPNNDQVMSVSCAYRGKDGLAATDANKNL